MANNAQVSDDLAKKFETEKDTPYLRWVRDQELDIVSAHYIPNLRTQKLRPWPRRGGRGVYINHDASRTTNDCYICEIPAGGKLSPNRQLFEEMVFVLDGRGSTAVWNNAGQRVTFEWQAGAIFGIPLNAWHQHFNSSGQQPARFVSVTNAPPVINLFEDLDFIFNSDRDFPRRFSGEADYFSGSGQMNGLRLETNYIPDAVHVGVGDTSERGAGSRMVRFNVARASIAGHISQFKTGTYKKAHAHGPGAHVIILNGEGYSLMWPEGEPPRRYEWQPGTLIVPPNMWFHQHFNTGKDPARYLAFKHGSQRNKQGVMMCWISRRLGGDQLDYVDEDPTIRHMFEEALAKNGLRSDMTEAYAKELENLPPKPVAA